MLLLQSGGQRAAIRRGGGGEAAASASAPPGRAAARGLWERCEPSLLPTRPELTLSPSPSGGSPSPNAGKATGCYVILCRRATA